MIIFEKQRQFAQNRAGVHLMIGEFTLCGDSFDIGDTEAADSNDGSLEMTNSKTITCPRCANIIKYCRGVRINPTP